MMPKTVLQWREESAQVMGPALNNLDRLEVFLRDEATPACTPVKLPSGPTVIIPLPRLRENPELQDVHKSCEQVRRGMLGLIAESRTFRQRLAIILAVMFLALLTLIAGTTLLTWRHMAGVEQRQTAILNALGVAPGGQHK